MKKLLSILQMAFLVMEYLLLVHHSVNFISHKLSQTVDFIGLIQTIVTNIMLIGLLFVCGAIIYSIIYKMISR